LICFLFEKEFFRLRTTALQQLRDAGENPYPHKFTVTSSLQDFIQKYDHLKEGEILEDVIVSVAGML